MTSLITGISKATLFVSAQTVNEAYPYSKY